MRFKANSHVRIHTLGCFLGFIFVLEFYTMRGSVSIVALCRLIPVMSPFLSESIVVALRYRRRRRNNVSYSYVGICVHTIFRTAISSGVNTQRRRPFKWYSQSILYNIIYNPQRREKRTNRTKVQSKSIVFKHIWILIRKLTGECVVVENFQ